MNRRYTRKIVPYQANHEGQLRAVYFSADVFHALLKQAGTEGICIYNATNDKGQDCFVLVGATSGCNLTEKQSVVYERGQHCPHQCVVSPLNHH